MLPTDNLEVLFMVKIKYFCDISFEVDIKFLIDNGYLVKPITKGALKQIDTSMLTIKKNGEYDDIELAEIVNKEELISARSKWNYWVWKR